MNGVKIIVFVGDRNKKAGKVSCGQSNTEIQIGIIHGNGIHFLVMNACDNKG